MKPRLLRFPWTGLVLFLGVAGFASHAEAHLVTTGLGPLYDGMGHLLLSPEEWATVGALALLAGLSGAAAGRLVLFVLPLSWLVGGTIGFLIHAQPPVAIAAIVLMLTGGLIAADFRLIRPVVGSIGAAIGLFHGYLNGVALVPAGEAALPLLGAALVIFVLVALVAAVVASVKLTWQRIAVRVAGSWIAATGLLLVGWAMRKG